MRAREVEDKIIPKREKRGRESECVCVCVCV